MFRLGVIINPVAGIGGSVGLKGSDGEVIQQKALALGAVPHAQQRMQQALQPLLAFSDQLELITASGDMGQNLCESMGFKVRVVYQPQTERTRGEDTEQALQQFLREGIDLLVFAGGDGTARNIYQVLGEHLQSSTLAVVGVPAGCKIHSSVYAVTPAHAGELLRLLVKGRPLSLSEASVMDIDEEAFRNDQVRARLFGYLQVPAESRFMQGMKEGGGQQQALAIQDIAAYLVDIMETDCLYLVGSGTTPRAVMEELGLPSTLLGVDAVYNRELIAQDLTEQQILQLLDEYPEARLIVTLIGGQGHLFGRGNQQISPQVIRRLGLSHIDIIATAEKLQSLQGRPVHVDTGDEELNQSLYGMVSVITGYEEKSLCRIAP